MSKLNRDQISALLQEGDDESMESGTDFSDESDDIYSPELDKTTGNDDSSSDSEETGLSDENGGIDDQPARGEEASGTVIWSTPNESFVSRKSVSNHRECKIAVNIGRHSTPYEIFRKLFPRSISLYIAQAIYATQASETGHQNVASLRFFDWIHL